MITYMYGHCDAFDVVYTQTASNQWQATVPPDLEDGKYIVDIYGIDNAGFVVYWSGILYMYNSKFIRLELLPESCVTYRTDNITVADVYIPSNDLDFIITQRHGFILLNREAHVSWIAVGYQS